jgi:16S rRNA processing protein RimM
MRASGALPADRMVVLGRIGAPWGVKGWVKVESYTDPPTGILNYPVWQVAQPAGQWAPVRVAAGRAHGAGRTVVVEFDGLASPEAARLWVGREVALPRSALPEPPPGEYYWDDLPGCRVATVQGRPLGVVSHFVELPANPVMVVRDGAADHWVPLVPRHLKSVDLATRQVVVDWDPEI